MANTQKLKKRVAKSKDPEVGQGGVPTAYRVPLREAGQQWDRDIQSEEKTG